MVSRLDPIKDHPTLLRAFARMQKQWPDSILLIVGDGPEWQHISSIAGKNVLLLGNRQDVPDILKALDLFVLSSRNEGISCAITEAMATGLPVVAAEAGGNPELVVHGRTGLLFAPGDENGLFHALATYYQDRHLATTHGMTGRKNMVELFSNEKMVQEYESLYKRVISDCLGS
jgi:glycosyltransferase involved in cell wall biosynthesis